MTTQSSQGLISSSIQNLGASGPLEEEEVMLPLRGHPREKGALGVSLNRRLLVHPMHFCKKNVIPNKGCILWVETLRI